METAMNYLPTFEGICFALAGKLFNLGLSIFVNMSAE